ncbi:hypothetical protein BDY19DRAFT_1060996 [Irpex rosettiformis]|uniref:Uncharacterized protein n=1 Tax=Irpex rosettiformis TaxID=378272 RepID=A0ACB8TMW3_9APHY|nr:hypothetical protein BDY19DRAFT_1060996 [Irpex rosettiformis]
MLSLGVEHSQDVGQYMSCTWGSERQHYAPVIISLGWTPKTARDRTASYYIGLTMAMPNDLISIQKDSGSQESRETVRAMAFCSLKALMYSWHALIMKYRSRSTFRFLAQQATIERLVQHHTFGNSVASIR